MAREEFRAASYPVRLFSGPAAIEKHLASEVDRVRASRAFVICSGSVTTHTPLVRRIEESLGERFAGVFDGIEKDSTYRSVLAAKDAASAANADLLIAVGGGSVIVAARAVAIFLGESASPFDLMTQYPDGKPAYSPRLLAPKLPLINIPTTPTSAMNRAGTALKNSELDQRMEYFDPKTRPLALLWDRDALLSAPPELIRSTATTVFSSALAGRAELDTNPLADGDSIQAFRLAHRAYQRLSHELENPEIRVDLCAAAFLQNRVEDDGGRGRSRSSFSGNYAVSTALHVRYPHVGQGESIAVVAAAALRDAPLEDAEPVRRVVEALGLTDDGMSPSETMDSIADAIEALYAGAGMPTQLRQLDIPRSDLTLVAQETAKNFNFNSGTRSERDQVAASLRLLEAAW